MDGLEFLSLGRPACVYADSWMGDYGPQIRWILSTNEPDVKVALTSHWYTRVSSIVMKNHEGSFRHALPTWMRVT